MILAMDPLIGPVQSLDVFNAVSLDKEVGTVMAHGWAKRESGSRRTVR
jgi:hypothetical protein